VTTGLAAALVAANLNARVTVLGFEIFIVAGIAEWSTAGSKARRRSIQNVILLCINAIGVWRWWYQKAEPSIIAFTATVSTRLIA